MYSLLKKCIYYVLAKTKYRIHSPIIFNFCSEVLDNTKWYYAFSDLTLFGKGSPLMDQWVGQVSQSFLLSSRTQNLTDFQFILLFKTAQWYQANEQIEINPNHYLSGLYLGLGNSDCNKYVHNTDPKDSNLLIKFYKSFPLDVVPLSHKISNKSKLLVLIHPGDIEQTMIILETHNILEKPCLLLFNNLYHNHEMRLLWQKIKTAVSIHYSIEFYGFGAILIDDSIIKSQEFKLIGYRHKPFQVI